MREFRIFLEALCCDLMRFHFVKRHNLAPEEVDVRQEVNLGAPNAFADFRVKAPNQSPVFVEVKYGFPVDAVVTHLKRKYGTSTPVCPDTSRLILVVNTEGYPNWPELDAKVRAVLRPGLKLEIWNEAHLRNLLQELLGLKITAFNETNLVEVRTGFDRIKGKYAFGDGYSDNPLESSLMWHFGFWRLRQLRDAKKLAAREILPPGLYQNVAVLIADLSSFSSYVRDSRDDDMVRLVLTSFYSKARYQVLNSGGMMYQFIGDGLVAVFGIPDRKKRFVEDALDCARALVDIGNSVSNEWQRHIDHVQEAGGCHFGLALGDLQVISMRPFGRARTGAIGDCINSAAGPSEMVVSNSFYQKLPERKRHPYHDMEPIEARNIRKIRCWRLPAPQASEPAAKPTRERS